MDPYASSASSLPSPSIHSPPLSPVISNSAVSFQKRACDEAEMTGTNITTVLVIYAGGTIGMQKDPHHGYLPVHGHLHNSLELHPSFHDAAFADAPGNAVLFHNALNGNSDDLAQGYYKPLITPPSVHEKRVLYQIHEYETLLDSSNMNMADWIRIANDIEQHYRQFDAFVILHGTDTMSYTASALSFLLENLGKTVILTGSQLPLSELRNDAADNFLGALMIAGHYVLPEVCLYFHHQLFRGNRTTKQKALDLDAFASPNLEPLAKVGVNIEVDWLEVLKSTELASFKAHKSLDPHVMTLRLFPGITAETLRMFLRGPIRGIVLETFGAGNAPSNRPELLEAISEATSAGIFIVNCTQCPKGTVSDLYATGKALSAIGVIPGHDMTTEAALTKLSFLLGHCPVLSPDEIRAKISDNLRGELSLPTKFISGHQSTEQSTLSALIKAFPQKTSADRVAFDSLLRPSLISLAAARDDLAALRGFLTKTQNSDDPRHPPFSSRDYTGATPLHAAISAGKIEATEWLLRHGASIYQKDLLGQTPLELAFVRLAAATEETQLQCFGRIVDLLTQTGASVAAYSSHAAAIAFQSIIDGSIPLLHRLFSAGLSRSIVDRHNRPLSAYTVLFPNTAQLRDLEALLSQCDE